MFKLEDTKGWGLTKWWPSDCLRITFSHICNSSAKPLAHQLLIFKLFSGNLETLLYPSQKPPETHPKSVTSLFSKTNLLYTVSGCDSKTLGEIVSGNGCFCVFFLSLPIKQHLTWAARFLALPFLRMLIWDGTFLKGLMWEQYVAIGRKQQKKTWRLCQQINSAATILFFQTGLRNTIHKVINMSKK